MMNTLKKIHGTGKCSICDMPKAGEGNIICSYPHDMMPERDADVEACTTTTLSEDRMTQDEFNEVAWRDFVLFAWGQDDAHAAFRGATGRPQRSRRGSLPIDLLIDKAIGGEEDDKYMEEFVAWVTRTQWGEDHAPKNWKHPALGQ